MSSEDKFSPFDIVKTSYKTVNSHPVEAYVLVPKHAKSGNLPVIVRFHGGCLIIGAALYPDWCPQYFIDYALENNAIVVAANYRLMPEANGLEILDDISDFWKWLKTDLNTHVKSVKPDVTADLNHVLVAGESAGGYLAIQSAITQPTGTIKAVLPTYPMIDMRADHYTKAYDKNILGAPMLPISIVDQYQAQIKPGDVVTENFPNNQDRAPFMLASVQHGRFGTYLGSEEILYPLETVPRAKHMPYTVVLHGSEDSVVPVEGSEKYVKLVKEMFGDKSIDLFIGPGDHGFDVEFTMETAGLKERLDKLKAAWLA